MKEEPVEEYKIVTRTTDITNKVEIVYHYGLEKKVKN